MELAHDYHNGDYTWKELRKKYSVSNRTISKAKDKYPDITKEDVKNYDKEDGEDSNTGDTTSPSSDSSKNSAKEIDGLELQVEDTRKQKNDSSEAKSMSEKNSDDGYEPLNPSSKKQVKFFAQKWDCPAKKARKGIKKIKKQGYSQVNVEENDVI